MEQSLVKAAWQARSRAYAPYSRFKVGAAIETDSGRIFSGCNVEVASYGCTICAERNAIFKAVSEGELEPGGLVRVCVATRTKTPTAPCGACRQVIEEFGNRETVVLLSNQPERIAAEWRHADLLPHSFSARDLNEG